MHAQLFRSPTWHWIENLLHRARNPSAMWAQHALVAFLVAGIIAPFSWYMGNVARLLRLPQISGYLISGIICGPYALGLLTTEAVTDLNIVEGACLSIIGLAAGAELHLPELHRSRKQVTILTVAVCAFTWVFTYVALLWTGHYVTAMADMDSSHTLAVATLGATLMMTRSPASAIAVLKEVDAKGSFSSLVMAVVVLKDVLVIVAFALNIDIIIVAIIPKPGNPGLSLRDVLVPIMSVIVSMSAGIVGGLLLSLLLAPQSVLMPAVGSISSQAAARLKTLGVLLISTCVFQATRAMDAEPLLACVTMGMYLVNRRSERAERDGEELHAMIAHIMSFSNVAFFGLAGASLKLNALGDTIYVALVVTIVRLLAIYFGSLFGGQLSGTNTEHKRLFWMSMVTQAGVAMGLARIAGTKFPDWGPHFQTLMMSIIILNMFLGPPLFRASLIRAGEARAQFLVHVAPKSSSEVPEMPELVVMAGQEQGNHREH